MEARADKDLNTATALVPHWQKLHANAAVSIESVQEAAEVRDATVDLLNIGDFRPDVARIFESQLESARRHHQRDPLNPRIALNYAAALTACDDPARALSVLSRSVLVEHDLEFQLERLRALAALGRWDETKADVKALLQREGLDADSLLQLATIAFMAADLSTARALYERLEANGFLTVAGENNLGVIDCFQHDNRRAIGAFRSALRSHVTYAVAYHNLAACQLASASLKKAEANARAAIRLVPTYRSAHVVLIRTLLASGQLDKAETSVKAALHVNPNVPEILDVGAKVAFDRKDFRGAFKRLTTSMYVDQATYPRLNNAAVALLEIGEWKKAIPLLRTALELQPAKRFAYENLALAYLRLGDPDASGHVISKGLSHVSARDAEGLYLLQVSVAARTGRPEMGLSAVNALIAGERRSARALLAAGVFLSEEFGRIEQAIDVLTAGLSAYPSDEKIANNLAYLLIPAGRMEEANQILEKFTHLYDQFPYLAATRGMYRLRRGDLEGGKRLYRRAMANLASKAERQRAQQKLDVEMGRALIRAGDSKKATAHLKAAVRVNAYAPFTREARMLLASLPE